MLIIADEFTVNFDNVFFIKLSDDTLVLDMKCQKISIQFNSTENANITRRLIESAYAHGEKICKI